ncbi:hypothetical protein FN846DRAFT_996586 [Sphaerosporella brunnea]|uniref:FDX-ACB domain-containing protein n=1 Tax=Sphaerosporella brunnea TaxID=1250544 RepID=A0A5J5F6F4_9PEZI|nr:hypothetical protein FN846DRAFT_996586 [Sphaerosporella brunnea]
MENGLELLGCSVVKQSLPNNAGVPDKLGWGVRRRPVARFVAMLLFGIPDIRHFRSKDEKIPEPIQGGPGLQVRAGLEVPAVLQGCGFLTQNLFQRPGAVRRERHDGGCLSMNSCTARLGRKSLCFRVNYRSLEKTLTNDETDVLHESVRNALHERYGVELR